MTPFETLLMRFISIPPKSSVENTLRLLVRMGLLVTGADEGSLLMFDQTANELVFVMTIGDDEGSAEMLRGQRVPFGEGITGLAAATLEVQIGAPVFKDVKQSVRADETTGDPSAVMAAPVMVEDRLIGVMTAVSFDPKRRFATQDARLFGGFAAIAGVLLDQAERLASMARAASDEAEQGPQSDIARSIARIVATRPEALGEIAVLVASIEHLANPR